MGISLKSVGIAHNERVEIVDDYWGNVITRIEIDNEQFEEDSLLNLDMFSHLEVIFYMHKLVGGKINMGSRHPRNNTSFPKMGIFAQRVKRRTNFLGLSRCNIVKVEGMNIYVRGLDVIDGTPIIDVKPFIKQFAPIGEVSQPEWANDVMKNYFLSGQEK